MKKRIIRLVVLLLILCTFALSDRGSYAAESGETKYTTPDTLEDSSAKKAGHWVKNQDVGLYFWENFDGSEGPKSSWVKIQGQYYYFDSKGLVVTNQYKDGNWVGDDGAWDPVRYGGAWHQSKTNGKWWYADISKAYPYDQWTSINGTCYYFDKEGYWVDCNSISVSPTSVTMNRFDVAKQLKVSAVAANGTTYNTSGLDYTWTTGNSSVATVDADGKVTARSEGTAVITAKPDYRSNISTKVTIKVVKPKFTFDDKLTMENDTIYIWPGYQFRISVDGLKDTEFELKSSNEDVVKCGVDADKKNYISAVWNAGTKKEATVTVSKKSASTKNYQIKIVVLTTNEKRDESFDIYLYKDKNCTKEFNPQTDDLYEFQKLYIGLKKSGKTIPVPEDKRVVYTGTGFVKLMITIDGRSKAEGDKYNSISLTEGRRKVVVKAEGTYISREINVDVKENSGFLEVEFGTYKVENGKWVFKKESAVKQNGVYITYHTLTNRIIRTSSVFDPTFESKVVDGEVNKVTEKFKKEQDVNYYQVNAKTLGKQVVSVYTTDTNEIKFYIQVNPFTEWVKDSKGMKHYTKGKPDNGWTLIEVAKGIKLWYFFSNNYRVTGWKQLGGKWYYFNPSMKIGWQKIGGKWYYFGTDGVMRAGWQKIGTKWYFLQGGAMKTGWMKSGGKWYYFGTDGAMVTGTKTIGGKTYRFNSQGVCLNP